MYATSLSGRAGDALRGRALVADRQYSLCLLCHRAPIEEARFQGMLAPDLKTAAAALSEVQLRARIADARRFNPETIMPAYYSTDGLQRVAPAYVGKTIFTAQDIEDVVAWLMSLK
jgi:sulfur-oxidizing protein SoxX